MKSRVRFTPAADRDVSRIDEWWRSNRPGSPALFASELRRFVALLRESPSIGVSYVGSKVKGLRRHTLHRTGHQLYYTCDPAARVVTVLAVWNALSGSEPDL